MQGWDSVEIRADVELGGTEQLFSLLVARDLQQSQGQEPQVALTMPILVGTDGVRRMGKSLGNYIGVAESAENQFGKVMSIPDEPMRQYFTLLTDLPMAGDRRACSRPESTPGTPRKCWVRRSSRNITERRQPSGRPPSSAGGPPARTPTRFPTSRSAADKLDAEGRIPAPILIKELGLDSSTSNARRVIEQGGFNVGPERETISDPKALIYVSDGLIVRVGKRKIARIRLV